jgi:hypothetical protein
LNIENGFFVEFGAWDGIRGSNCRKLFEEGWGGIFIESDKHKYDSLYRNYRGKDNVVCINSKVGIENEEEKFDNLIKNHTNREIDFCSIDIDGLDLEVFETFEKFLPTVVCIEGGQMLEPHQARVSMVQAKRNIQQSLSVFSSSFAEKGYKLLCTYQDSFFVKEKYFEKFDVSSDIENLYYNGLLSHHRRIPWIQTMVRSVGLENKIIDKILKETNYSKYGYENRKTWAIQEKEIVIEFITSILDANNKKCGSL